LKDIKCIHNTVLDCSSQHTSVLLANFHVTSSFSNHIDGELLQRQVKSLVRLSHCRNSHSRVSMVTSEDAWELYV